MTFQQLLAELERRGYKPAQPLTAEHVTALIVQLDDLRRDMRHGPA